MGCLKALKKSCSDTMLYKKDKKSKEVNPRRLSVLGGFKG